MYQVSDINTWKVYQVARKTNISGGGGGVGVKGGGGWTVCRFKGRVWLFLRGQGVDTPMLIMSGIYPSSFAVQQMA